MYAVVFSVGHNSSRARWGCSGKGVVTMGHIGVSVSIVGIVKSSQVSSGAMRPRGDHPDHTSARSGTYPWCPEESDFSLPPPSGLALALAPMMGLGRMNNATVTAGPAAVAS